MTSLKSPGTFERSTWSVRKNLRKGCYTAVPNIVLVPAKNPTVASHRLDRGIQDKTEITSEAHKSG